MCLTEPSFLRMKRMHNNWRSQNFEGGFPFFTHNLSFPNRHVGAEVKSKIEDAVKAEAEQGRTDGDGAP